MEGNTRECTVSLPLPLLEAAASQGLLVKTGKGGYFGLSQIVERALNEKVQVPV